MSIAFISLLFVLSPESTDTRPTQPTSMPETDVALIHSSREAAWEQSPSGWCSLPSWTAPLGSTAPSAVPRVQHEQCTPVSDGRADSLHTEDTVLSVPNFLSWHEFCRLLGCHFLLRKCQICPGHWNRQAWVYKIVCVLRCSPLCLFVCLF